MKKSLRHEKGFSRRFGKIQKRAFFLGVVVVAAASIYAFFQAKSNVVTTNKADSASHKITPEDPLSGKNEFGQFQPSTDAERELERMLHGKDEDIDLALANWLIASDIPQFSNLTHEAYLKELDAMTEKVRQDMALMRVSGWKGANPKDPASRCRMFCNAIIRLRFAYREEFRNENLTPAQIKALYSDADNIFLAGLVRTRRGSCVSMPLIYLAIGQRLGMPVHLVNVGKHYFIRWDEPKFRMNIETTIVEKVSVTPDDSVYLDVEGMKHDQVKGSQLRNLTNREVIGNLFYARSGYWAMKGAAKKTEQCLDLSRANYLSPDDPEIAATHKAVFDLYRIKPEYTSIDIRPKP